MEYNILHIEDSKTDADLVKRLLLKSGMNFTYKLASDKNEVIELLKTFEPDVILCDHSLPSFDSKMAHALCKEKKPNVPFLLVTGTVSEEYAVEMLKSGVDDYLLKSNLQRLPIAIENAVSKRKIEKKVRKFQTDLHISETQLRTIFENTSFGLLLLDPNCVILELNELTKYFSKITFGHELVKNENLLNVIPAYRRNDLLKNFERSLQGEMIQYEAEYKIPEGSKIILNVKLNPSVDSDGTVVGVCMTFEDISEQKRLEEKLIKSNRLYAFISAINQSIVHTKDERTLFSKICLIAHTIGKFKMAWIGKFDHNNKKMILINQCGIPENITHLFSASYEKNGPQDHILRSGSYYVCNNIEKDLELESWKPFAALNGIKSCIILPIKKEGSIIGSFNLYATEINFFDEEEITLLEEATGDISFALDVFEKEVRRKQAEEIVIKNEKRFSALIEKSADMKTLTNEKGNFIYCSPSVTKVFGYSQEAFLNVAAFTFFHPDDLPDLMKKRASIIEVTGGSFSFQYRFLHKNGSWIWCEGTLTNMLHEPGINAFVSNFRDITNRKRAEEELIKSELFNRGLINSITAHIAVVDEQGTITSVNNAWTEFSIQNNETLLERTGIGSNYISVCNRSIEAGDSLAADALKGFQKVLHKEIPFFEMEYPCHSKHEERWFLLKMVNFSDDAPKVLMMHIDISKLKKTEKQLKELHENAQKHSKQLELSNIELEQFAYVASHDLQEPLRMVISFLSQLEKKYGNTIDDKGKKYISFAVDGAKRMRQIILDLLEFSRVGKTEDQLEYLKLNDILNEVKLLLRKHIEEKSATISIDQLPEIRSHRVPLLQVFQNLISNALKYSNKEIPVQINITVKEFNDHWLFAVIDNGIGIEKEYFDKIFIIFQRLHNKDEYSGTGMGLAITKKIIESKGGKIWVESEIGKGSSFYFTLKK